MKKKYNIKNKLSKSLMAIMLLVSNFLICTNSVYAASLTDVGSVNLYKTGMCGDLITYKGIPVIASYVEYNYDGVSYPAYCLDKTKPGPESGSYDATIQSTIQDVGLWRVVINGYPYKTLEELGVANKEEAYIATKHAIYCYIHENNAEDYGPLESAGEAGIRTANALKNIVYNASISQETKISSTISINKLSNKWEQDNMDKNYVSKEYSVSAGAQIENYKIKITKDNGKELGDIKITNMNNEEQNEFSPNENFKVLIPIKNMQEKDSFKLEVEAKVKTKPVFYGISQKAGSQDHAVTTSSFEDGVGTITDDYEKNETKIIVLKKDQETGEAIQGVEFELLNKDLEPVYTDLKTDENGRIIIENLVPDLYYLNETKTIDGYELYTQLVKVELDYNEEITVTVNNKKAEKTSVNTKIETGKTIRTLPVTGM